MSEIDIAGKLIQMVKITMKNTTVNRDTINDVLSFGFAVTNGLR